MRRNRYPDFTYVVVKVAFRQLVADTGMQGISEAAGFTGSRHEARIDSNADDVITRRNRRLSVPTIKHEELSGKKEAVGVSPAMANTLITRNADSSAIPELRTLWLLSAGAYRRRVGIQHAKTLFGRLPDKAGVGIYQLI